MAKKIKITAICGWALPEDWFGQLVESYFPLAQVSAHYPENPESQEDAMDIFSCSPDWVIGYSLGSLWLLYHKALIPSRTKVALLAPILAFPLEKNLGGKTPLGKLKYQKKMLSSSDDYADALKGFFDLSGIRLPQNNLKEPYKREILISGLNFLETIEVDPVVAQDCMAFTGIRDPLLDADQLKTLIPDLNLVENCDHSPHKLLEQLSRHPVMDIANQNQVQQEIHNS